MELFATPDKTSIIESKHALSTDEKKSTKHQNKSNSSTKQDDYKILR